VTLVRDQAMAELLAALRDNFAAQERMRQMLLNKTPRYGNDDDYADAIMQEVFEAYYRAVHGRPNTKGWSYEINLLRCVFCGDCELACPTEAIVLGHEFALANYDRRDFILDKEQLLNPDLPQVIIRPE
jgi:ferredoxin